MKLYNILILKSFRESLLIDISLMALIIIGTEYKETILFFLLIPFFLSHKIYNFIWNEEREKFFFLQFKITKLKRIAHNNQTLFFLEFNLIYIITTIMFSFLRNCIKIEYWIILNIFVLSNIILGNLTFKYLSIRKNIFNPIFKSIVAILFNVLIIIIVFSIKMFLESYLYFLLGLLLVLFYLRFQTFTILFSKIKNIYLHD